MSFMTDCPPIDPYTIHHLDVWLDAQISGDTLRAAIRNRMLEFIADDPEYWGAQAWWLIYDRADCRRIKESLS
jgi:hypothetical protein